MTVIVTGASGYIGGHIALSLVDQGHDVVGVDMLPLPKCLQGKINFFQTDFDSAQVRDAIHSQPSAIIHCAGTSLVGPSIQDPKTYYNNNVVKTLRMIDHVCHVSPKSRVIFSSSASVYGNPVMVPCNEVDPTWPISPYGESKRMVEMILESYGRAYALDYVIFRYFNAAGADDKGRHGQNPGATHLVARLLDSVKNHTTFELYGDTYHTQDGTCVRDFVHVQDIANAHVLAMKPILPAGVYNLGSGQGHSVRQVIDCVQKVTSQQIAISLKPPRTGDPACLIASTAKFESVFPAWIKHNLLDIVSHAWARYV